MRSLGTTRHRMRSCLEAEKSLPPPGHSGRRLRRTRHLIRFLQFLVVADLMDKVAALIGGQNLPNRDHSHDHVHLLRLPQKLSVKDDLSARRSNVPAAAQIMVVPPGSPFRPSRTRFGRSLSGARLRDPASAFRRPKPDVHSTALEAPDAGHDSSLTDFLAPPQADDELGRLGKYRILKILGHGGMGVVFQAEDPKLKRTVAIKAMLPTLAASASAGKRFLREAQAMAAVEHDHIVRIYQVDEDRGVPFLAMEFLKGEPLDERLKRDGKLPLAEVLRIGREIAEGLAAAHATGLIHRDIKPANIWLERTAGTKGAGEKKDQGVLRPLSRALRGCLSASRFSTSAWPAPPRRIPA